MIKAEVPTEIYRKTEQPKSGGISIEAGSRRLETTINDYMLVSKNPEILLQEKHPEGTDDGVYDL